MSKILVISDDATVASRLQQTARRDAFQVSHTGWTAWEEHAAWPRMAVYDAFLFDFTTANAVSELVSARVTSELRQLEAQGSVLFMMSLEPNIRDVVQALASSQGVTLVDPSVTSDAAALEAALVKIKNKESPRAFPHLMPQLRDANSGRLDARRVGELFGIPLKGVAAAIGAESAAVYKTPDSPALQERLLLFEKVARALLRLVGSVDGLRIWLNTPEPDLDNEIPRELLLNGEGDVVVDHLEDMLMGQPS